ncbi:MAG: methyltransferase domain-containing protein [Acetobacteraceae bacterium]|nr:methyltransferase domain-containing protein [Acetobacteraceae bacterium]
MRVLEIGPSYAPVVTRAQGWDVCALDHSTQDELRQKYANEPGVDVSRIGPVDFVWRDGPLETAFPEEALGGFDACIGSHMIEHMPDLVAFFRSMERVLAPGGVLSLVVPDKRFCFDFFQPLTLTGDVLEAHRVGRTRHARSAEFNASAYMVSASGEICWGQRATGLLAFRDGDIRAARDQLFDDTNRAHYRDVHGWYFTYSSFRLIMLELAELGMLDFHEVESFPTENCEFFITMARGRKQRATEVVRRLRMELLTNVLMEVRDQADFLIQGPNYVGPVQLAEE